jgi:hypothetical protein
MLGSATLYFKSPQRDGQVPIDGVPRILNIVSSCSRHSPLPGNNTSPIAISLGIVTKNHKICPPAKMQPMDHISIAVEWSVAPRRISGERYHRTDISSVAVKRTGMPQILARPKSAIFSVPFPPIRMFCGLISLFVSFC